jgi:nitroreductase
MKDNPNPVLEAIKNRRSTRCYNPKPVPREVLAAIIEAGDQAPFTSMTLSQPWRFVVVENPEFKRKLFETALPIWTQAIEGLKENAPEMYEVAVGLRDAMSEPKDPIYYSAPAIVFVIGPSDNAVSCALACENLMIAAQALGLGSCYVGFGAMVKGNLEVTQTLGLKDGEEIYGPILLGYAETNPKPALAKALEKVKLSRKAPVTKWV